MEHFRGHLINRNYTTVDRKKTGSNISSRYKIVYNPFSIKIAHFCIGPLTHTMHIPISAICTITINNCSQPSTVIYCFIYRCTRYNIMWSSLSVTWDRSVVFSGFSTNKIDHHYITEISLKVALNPIILPLTLQFVCDVWQIGGFLRFPTPIKLICHDIVEILLKVALSTTTLILILTFSVTYDRSVGLSGFLH